MGAPSKRANRTRKSEEFDLIRIAASLLAPRSGAYAHAWKIPKIRAAVDEQMHGRFIEPALLAKAMRRDDALFTAYQNRLAPARGLPVLLEPASQTARAVRIQAEGDALFGPKGVGVHPETMADINGCLANHGVAFGVNVLTPRDDGSRIDIELHSWPIENVWWDSVRRCFMTRIDPMTGREEDRCLENMYGVGTVPIIHGDGRWVIFQKHEWEPWTQDAAILSAALVWARHAFVTRDWSRGATTHANAKVIGEMPPGIGINTAEGLAYLDLLKAVASVETPYGIKPHGAGLDYITNNSTAWQIYKELAVNSETAAARIYLGQDGLLGSNTNAPGIDLRGMFGVRDDIVEGDLRAMERGVQTGVIEVWAALNFGDSSLAPVRRYVLPDADEDANRATIAKNRTAFWADLAAARDAQIVEVDQAYVDKLAADYGIRPPTLKSTNPIPSVGAPPGSQSSPPTAGVTPPASLRRLA